MKKKTSLSVGEAVFGLLTSDPYVMGMATKVFPVMTTEAKLPYVAYRRAGLAHSPTKAALPGSETAKVEVHCYAATYAESVELAEIVRDALEGYSWKDDETQKCLARRITLSDASEVWEDDAFVQQLTFDIGI